MGTACIRTESSCSKASILSTSPLLFAVIKGRPRMDAV